MPEPDRAQRRETRLLLVTIVISIGMLFLLARFRFPQDAVPRSTEPPAPPLQRLAARATFEELASAMADLERRVAASVEVLRIEPERPTGAFVPAPRITADRAVVVLGAGETLVTGSGDDVPEIIGRDGERELAVVAVPPQPDGVVTPRGDAPRPGPRYVGVVDATQRGAAIRPVYLGRVELVEDPRTGAPLLSVAALPQTLPRGAAVFGLDGRFVGLAGRSGGAVAIVPAESLRAFVENAPAPPANLGDLGVDVQPLTEALARATGAERGVVVAYVEPRGPAADVLNPGDVIRSIDGIEVTSFAGFQQIASSRLPGATVALSGIRRGKPLQANVRAVAAGTRGEPAQHDPGVTVRALQGVGLEVVALQPSSPAAQAGLQPGDIIVTVGGISATDAGGLSRAYREAPAGGAVLLTLRRGTGHLVVALEKP